MDALHHPRAAISARRLAGLLTGGAPAVDDRPGDGGGGGGQGPRYLTLALAVRGLIIDGRVAVDTRLPGQRSLATELGMSRTTVTAAYEWLGRHGYASSRQGSGTRALLPLGPGRVDHLMEPWSPSDGDLNLVPASSPAPPELIAAYHAAVDDLPHYTGSEGYYPTGLPVLQEVVAGWFGARDLPTVPQQVVVVPGALAGIALVADTVTRRGDRVLIESPTYPNAIAAWQRCGVRLQAWPVDQWDGWDLDALDDGTAGSAAGRAGRVAACYLTPEFQNPTGHLMSDPDRRRVGQLLGPNQVVAVIDETMVDLTLDQPVATDRPPPLARHVPGAYTVGSLSKSWWGGLRVGWVRAPSTAAATALARRRLRWDLGTPVLEQVVAARLRLDEGPLMHRRDRLRRQRDILLGALATHLPRWRVRAPAGGQVVWCHLDGLSSTALSQAARAEGLVVLPGTAFAPAGGLDGFLRLPFTAPEEALAGVGPALARSVDQARRLGGDPTTAGPVVA